MATQTIEFRSPPSQTVTLRLFVVGSDTQVASAVATEATNRKGTYLAAFTDVPALEYSYVATIGTSPIIPVASGYVLLTLTTATFQVYDFAKDRDGGGGGGGATAEEIADAVWDEQYSQHTTAGTFGKLFDIWRKSNPAIDGVVTALVTPTTTTFSTNITGYPSGAFIHSVLLFVNGSTNAESNSPIVGYVSANGVITLEEPMQAAVQVGDEFVIAANSHVHPIASIAAGIWNSLLATYQAVGSFGKAIADTKADTTTLLASAGVNVLPAVGISASRAPGVFLSPFVGELISQSITVYASDGTTPIDLSAKTLEIVFEARGGGDIAVIADGDITISGDDDNVVTFAYPSAVTAQERTLRFSLRDAGTPFTVYLTGLCKVSIAPSNDPA
jgi:hypothetical protein